MKITVLMATIAWMLCGCVLPPSRAEVYQKEMQQRDAAERERKAVEQRQKQEVEKQEQEAKDREYKERQRKLLAKIPCKLAYLIGPAMDPMDRWDIDDTWMETEKKTNEMLMRVSVEPFRCKTSFYRGSTSTYCSGHVYKRGLPVAIDSASPNEGLIYIKANIPMTTGESVMILKTRPESLVCP